VSKRHRILLGGVFAATGFAALCLQVVWQRVISLHAGVDLVSFTTIISAFLAGLGVGNLLGGSLADRLGPRRALLAFAAANVGIGLYAWVSLQLLYDLYRDNATSLDTTAAKFAFNVALLLVPTVLMGLSLPLVAKGIVERAEDAGPLVGRLYAINTIGAAAGAAIVWVAGAVALHVPGQVELREEVQRSRILRELNARVPPSRLLDAIARVDPFAAIRGPEANVAPPDPGLLATAGVRAARASVFRVTGTACGLGVVGSGWAAAPNLVVTNAHVVAGMTDARVDRRDEEFRDAVVVAFDARNDIAVLRVEGLGAKPLQAVDPVEGQAVAILGYPENRPFTATPGRIGQTASVLTDDALGRGPVQRLITTLRGEVRQGNSGGPAVDGRGRVQTTIFASRVGSDSSGYGVPTSLVREELAGAGAARVSTGPCVR